MTSYCEEILFGDEIEQIPAPEPLLAGILDRNSLALLYGPSGVAKSFVALDWGLSIATARPWHGHAVCPSLVLYVVGEGLSGMNDRYAAWKAHNGVSGDIPRMAWGPRAPNVLTPEGAQELREAVIKTEPAFVILDTIARHIPGGDENTFETMSRLVEMMDWIKTQQGACVLAVHHTGKDTEAGARGHSSLKAAMDTEIFCGRGPVLTATKQKNHADGHIVGSFDLQAVGASMVLVEKARRTNPNDELVTRALAELGGHAHYAQLKSCAESLGLPGGSFARTLDRLLEGSILSRDTTDTDTWYRFT